METAGRRLKNLREQKNISLEQVYKETKIHIDVLRNLEADRFDKLPPAYAKSLLRLYAKFLGEEPGSIVKSSGLEETSKEGDVFKYRSSAPRKKPQFKLPKIEKKTVVFIISVVLIYIIGLTLVRAIRTDKDVKVDMKTEESKKVPDEGSPSNKDKKIAASKKSSLKDTLQIVRLGIHAKKSCWFKVVIDGKSVFQGVLRRNKVESWQANKIIELSVGDASLVDIEVNGKLIAPLGRKGQTVKDIQITSEGIVAGK